MTDEDIKRTWKEAAERIYCPTSEEFADMYREKKETALERLAARYRRFSRLGLLMIVMWVCIGLSPTLSIIGSMKWVFVGVSALYFGFCSCMDYWLYKGVSSIDCFTMTVNRVAELARYYRKKHLQSILVLLPFAILLIGALAYCFRSETYMIWGIILGAIAGFVLGFRQLQEFLHEYKVVSRE